MASTQVWRFNQHTRLVYEGELEAYKSLHLKRLIFSTVVMLVQFFYECSGSSNVAVLKADVNPSQNPANEPELS